MKNTVKIFLFSLVLVLMNGCCSQKCAERRIRRMVERYPELVQLKQRTIDTFLTVPGYTDCTIIPMSAIASGETVCEATDHGTFTVTVNHADSTVSIGFVADTQLVRYQDTVNYRQIVIAPEKEGWFDGFWDRLSEWITFIFIGAAATVYLLRNALKNKQ